MYVVSRSNNVCVLCCVVCVVLCCCVIYIGITDVVNLMALRNGVKNN